MREVAAVIADESVDARVIFSVREDYLAALDDMQRRLPHLFTQSYRLMPLTAFGAREAIVSPLLKIKSPTTKGSSRGLWTNWPSSTLSRRDCRLPAPNFTAVRSSGRARRFTSPKKTSGCSKSSCVNWSGKAL